MGFTIPKPRPQIVLTECFIPLNVKNKNGRIYTREELEPHIQEFLNRKNSLGVIYGEFDTPDGLDISLSRVSHVIEDVWFDQNKLMGKVRILNTFYGKEVRELIDDGIAIVVRPRSADTVDSNGYVIEKLFTFDIYTKDKDAFYDITELRKEKLNKLNENFVGKEEKLPTLEEDFFFLKK